MIDPGLPIYGLNTVEHLKVRKHYLSKGLDATKRSFWWKKLLYILEYRRRITISYKKATELLADPGVGGSGGIVPLCLYQLLLEKAEAMEILSAELLTNSASGQSQKHLTTSVKRLCHNIYKRYFYPLWIFLLDRGAEVFPIRNDPKNLCVCEELCAQEYKKLKLSVNTKESGLEVNGSFLFLWKADSIMKSEIMNVPSFVLEQVLHVAEEDRGFFLLWLQYKGYAMTAALHDNHRMLKFAPTDHPTEITLYEKSLMSLVVLMAKANFRIARMKESKYLLSIQAKRSRSNQLKDTAAWCEKQMEVINQDLLVWNNQLDKTLLAITKAKFQIDDREEARLQKRCIDEINIWLKMLDERQKD